MKQILKKREKPRFFIDGLKERAKGVETQEATPFPQRQE